MCQIQVRATYRRNWNAFFILARVTKAMRRAGYPKEDIDCFNKEATSGNYDNLLRVCMEWVEEGSDDEEDNEEESMALSEDADREMIGDDAIILHDIGAK